MITLSYRDALLNKTISVKDFIVKRCATAFPLQWLFTLLFVICSINVVSYWAIPFHLTLTQSLIPFWEIDFTLNTPSWFLSSIFICYLLTPPLLGKIKKRKTFITLFFVMMLLWQGLLYFLPEAIGRRWLCYISPFSRIFDYGMGMVLAMYWSEVKEIFIRLRDRIALYTILEVLALCLMGICMFRPQGLSVNKFLVIGSPFLSAIMCIFVSIFCVGRGFISKMMSYPIFNKLGALSIAIYMSHGFVLNYTNRLVEDSLVIYILLSLTTVLVFSYILERYYCRHMKQWVLNLCNKFETKQ